MSVEELPKKSLKFLFVLHFCLDVVFAIPMFFFPAQTLGIFGWQVVDPVATRVVAAALFGIGIQSLLSRDADKKTYRALLSLKIIWSFFASVGIAVSLVQQQGPELGWALFGVFASFFIIWTYQFRTLRST